LSTVQHAFDQPIKKGGSLSRAGERASNKFQVAGRAGFDRLPVYPV